MRLLTFLLFAGVFYALNGASLKLAENGKTDYSIVLQKNASDIDKFAAKELAFFLKKITGADFAISNEKKSPAIFIGHDKGAKLADEVNIVETSGKDLLLYGGGIHGNLWAVYELLENHLGCVFFNAFGDFYAPEKANLTINEVKKETKYAFPVRAVMNYFYKDKNLASTALYRNRQNVLLHSFNHPRFPGNEPGVICKFETYVGSHSLFQFIPPGVKEVKTGHNAGTGILSALPELRDKRYFVTNPEFFTMDQSGKRVPNRQLCFSNPALRKELEKNIRMYYDLQFKRTKGLKGHIEISCNDIAYKLCYCPDCTKLEKEYGTPGAVILLALADIASRNKDITFRTLAYQRSQTQHPPKKEINIPDNLIIIFAPINGDYANPLDKGKENAIDLKDFNNWSKITKNILFWYYPCPYNRNREIFFTEPPNGLAKRFARDWQIMHKNGILGPYVEHDAGGIVQFTNFSEMQGWLMLKLAQNPYADLNKLIETFISKYYGSAAPVVLKYFNSLAAELDNFTAKNGKWNYRTIDASYLTKDNLLKWEKMLDEAEKLVTGEYAFRVRLLRVGLDCTIISKISADNTKRMERVRNTMLEMQKKRPVNVDWKRFNEWSRNIADRGKELPLPPAFSNIKNIVVIPTAERGPTIKAHKGANLGRAFVEQRKGSAPFRIGLYDRVSKKHILAKVFDSGAIKNDRFDFYLINTKPVTLTPSTICYGGSWYMNYNIGAAAVQRDNAESLAQKFYIFVSLKEENNTIFSDRICLVPAEQCPEILLVQRLPGQVDLPAEMCVKGMLDFAVAKNNKNAVADPDANFKRALPENWNGQTAFRVGIYDTKAKKYNSVRLLKASEIPVDGKFHLVKFNASPIKVTASSSLFGGRWAMLFFLGAKADVNTDYTIYMSLKREDNRLLCDRVIMLPAK